jgi:hypothetical protein
MEEGSPMMDLNTLVSNPSDLFLTEASFITDNGSIVARGPLPDGQIRTAILIPDDASNETEDQIPTRAGRVAKPLPSAGKTLRPSQTYKSPRYWPRLRRQEN